MLLVEDSEDDVFLIKEAFAQEDLVRIWDVVPDGEQALSFLRQEGPYCWCNPPGLVMLDINMPKKNGSERISSNTSNPLFLGMLISSITMPGGLHQQ